MTKSMQTKRKHLIWNTFPEIYPSNLMLTIWSHHLEIGGGGRNRTDDLKLAKLPLSQLSYAPILKNEYLIKNGGPGKTWTSDLTLIRRAL